MSCARTDLPTIQESPGALVCSPGDRATPALVGLSLGALPLGLLFAGPLYTDVVSFLPLWEWFTGSSLFLTWLRNQWLLVPAIGLLGGGAVGCLLALVTRSLAPRSPEHAEQVALLGAVGAALATVTYLQICGRWTLGLIFLGTSNLLCLGLSALGLATLIPLVPLIRSQSLSLPARRLASTSAGVTAAALATPLLAQARVFVFQDVLIPLPALGWPMGEVFATSRTAFQIILQDLLLWAALAPLAYLLARALRGLQQWLDPRVLGRALLGTLLLAPLLDSMVLDWIRTVLLRQSRGGMTSALLLGIPLVILSYREAVRRGLSIPAADSAPRALPPARRLPHP